MIRRSQVAFTMFGAVLLSMPHAGHCQAQAPITQFEYDANGNLTKVVDGLLNTTHHTYDKLNRRNKTVDADAKVVSYDYDGQDQLVGVTDQRQLRTSYTVDGLGNVTVVASPDTGSTVASYDESGNVLTSRDANGQLTSHTYDILNRITSIRYADASTTAYTYDQGPNAMGRLSRISDASGSISYGYDDLGRTVLDQRTVGSETFSVIYRYDGEGRMSGITYPSGREVVYGFDSEGRVNHISTINSILVADVRYQSFGPINAIKFGNGQSQVRTFDSNGRLDSFTLGAKTVKLGYDAASRITSTTNPADPAGGKIFGYDAVDRLTSFTTTTAGQTYLYDGVGNRIQQANNGAVTPLSYGATNNRLTQVGGQAISTDPNGSIVDQGNATYTYDARGRMVTANTSIGIVRYLINGLGQRVRKITPSATIVYHYDLAGKLIAESEVKNGVTRFIEHIYLDDIPVAVIK